MGKTKEIWDSLGRPIYVGDRLKDSLRSCAAQTLVLAGSRELPVMKRSARALAAKLPHARLEILSGYTHGELSLNHSRQYVDKLLHLLEA